MLSHLKIEWIKLKYYRTFWSMLVLCAASIFALNFMAYGIINNSTAKTAMLLQLEPFSFPNVWQTVSYISGFLLFLPGLLIITIITNEFTFRTHRQNIIDGLSRSQFIQVKLTTILILSLFVTLVVFLCSLLFGFLSKGPFLLSNFKYIGYFFLQSISYCSVAFLFGLFIKRSGLAIALYFVYIWIIEKMTSNVLNLLGGFYPGNYLPLSAADKLIPIPFAEKLPGVFDTGVSPLFLLIALAAYYIITCIITLQKFNKEDL